MVLLHLRNDGVLEEVHARGVVGRFGEVGDRVTKPQSLERVQLLGDLLRRADTHPGALGLDLLVDPRLGDTCRDVVLAHPGQPFLDVFFGFSDDDIDVGGPCDLGEVPADVLAVGGKDLALVLEDVRREVGVVRVLRRDAQGLLLAASGNPDRYAVQVGPGLRRPLKWPGRADRPVDLIMLALQRGRSGGPHVAEDLNPFLKRPEPLPSGGEVPATDAIGTPLVLIPTGADAHLQATLRDDVDRCGDLGQAGGIAITHAGAHLSQPDPAGHSSKRGHHGPRLVGGLLRRDRHRVEVVIDPDRLPQAGQLGTLGQTRHHPPVLVRLDAGKIHPPALRNKKTKSHWNSPHQYTDVKARHHQQNRHQRARRAQTRQPRPHRGYCAAMTSITSGDISEPAVIRRLLTTPATWAVVGLSTDATRTAYGVARWMHDALGHRIIPVHPRAEEVWGEPGCPALAQIPDGTVVSVVDFFINSLRVGEVVDDAILNKDRLRIQTVWLQLGVIDQEAAQRAIAAGLDVVMDTCPMIEFDRLGLHRTP